MKKLIFFSPLLLLASCKTMQLEENRHVMKMDAARKIDKAHQHAPPGTIWIKDSIYMDQTEISNLDYLEYVRWLKMRDTIQYIKALPDSTVWLEKNSYNQPYVRYYFMHPAYRHYPVVGVSYEQALAYCEWRTESEGVHSIKQA